MLKCFQEEKGKFKKWKEREARNDEMGEEAWNGSCRALGVVDFVRNALPRTDGNVMFRFMDSPLSQQWRLNQDPGHARQVLYH